jgi:hypothetical protein
MRFENLFFRLKQCAVVAALMAAAGALLLAGAMDNQEATTAEASAGQSLIRKDLLKQPWPADVRPRRNIFVRGGGTAVEPGPPVKVSPSRADTASDKAEPESIGPDIRYVGCVVTPRKTVAIVLVDGQALAVAEGDQVAAFFVVQKISPEALELADPDGRRRTISITGEKQ